MILSSHIIVASAVTAPLLARPLNFANAFFIFFISFASHFLIDMIPHWDYKMFLFPREDGEISFFYKKYFLLKDLLKNFLDGAMGLFGAILIIGFPADFMDFLAFGLIVFGSVLPDALEASFIIKKWRFLEPLHKFHNAIHGRRVFRNRPFYGFIFQAFIVALIVLLLF